MSSVPNALSGGIGRADKNLQLGLADTFRLAWADEELRGRILFVLTVFTIYCLGIHVPVSVPGIDSGQIQAAIENNPSAFIALINMMGGGAFAKLSVFALGLGPYITASIVMQVLQQGIPSWKQEVKEGGEYARKQMNKRTRTLTIALCLVQGFGLLTYLGNDIVAPGNNIVLVKLMVSVLWMGGAMFLLWLGEQVSEKGIGNGVSLLIFAGIVISFPNLVELMGDALRNGVVAWWQILIIALFFLVTTWVIVLFTIAQRRIPIQHMRRNFGTKSMGGQTSYLPISVNMAGVIPIIFAISLVYMPAQFASMFPQGSTPGEILNQIAIFFSPDFTNWKGWMGALVYALMIFGFTYFWNAMMYNVEDISDNLKKGGSYIPGIRPGKQTTEFLNSVISRITFVGAVFLAVVALTQFVFPLIAPIENLGLLGGTSILIMVSVALETMRQIEANLIVKQYDH